MSEKFDPETNEPYAPGHSLRPQKKDPVQKQLSGLSAQIRVLTDKVEKQVSAFGDERASVIRERKAELAPVLEAGRKAKTEMRKATDDLRPAIQAILGLPWDSI